MSNSRSRINTVGTVLAATALIAGLSNSAQAQQTGVIRTVLMSDGCNYVHNPDGWLRVGCTLTDGQRLYFRNDMEGGVLYIWAAGPNSPFWQRLSVDAQVAHNQASDQKPAQPGSPNLVYGTSDSVSGRTFSNDQALSTYFRQLRQRDKRRWDQERKEWVEQHRLEQQREQQRIDRQSEQQRIDRQSEQQRIDRQYDDKKFQDDQRFSQKLDQRYQEQKAFRQQLDRQYEQRRRERQP